MFLLRAKSFLDELELHSPAISRASRAAFKKAARDVDFLRLDETEFSACPSNSIDYAVMEKTENGMVVPLACGWSDVGSWATMWEIGQKDDDGNVCQGDVIQTNSRNNYFRSSSRLISALGVTNLVVVETVDAVLIAAKDQVQNVKSIVSQLKSSNRSEHLFHRNVNRPWGSFDSLALDSGFQVKHILVNPGQVLSLQLHNRRAEHWIVVKGTAEVTCDDSVFSLTTGQATYIPQKSKHRLANHQSTPLEIIEIQIGDYFGEDDIVRFDDVYGRSGQS